MDLVQRLSHTRCKSNSRIVTSGNGEQNAAYCFSLRSTGKRQTFEIIEVLTINFDVTSMDRDGRRGRNLAVDSVSNNLVSTDQAIDFNVEMLVSVSGLRQFRTEPRDENLL